MKKSLASISLSVLMTLASGAAFAQGEVQASTTQQTAPQTVEISEAAVDKFIEVQQKVESIRGEYVELLQQAEDKQTAMEIQQEAQEKMVEKVQSSGMTVQQFNLIAQAAQQIHEMHQCILKAKYTLTQHLIPHLP